MRWEASKEHCYFSRAHMGIPVLYWICSAWDTICSAHYFKLFSLVKQEKVGLSTMNVCLIFVKIILMVWNGTSGSKAAFKRMNHLAPFFYHFKCSLFLFSSYFNTLNWARMYRFSCNKIISNPWKLKQNPEFEFVFIFKKCCLHFTFLEWNQSRLVWDLVVMHDLILYLLNYVFDNNVKCTVLLLLTNSELIAYKYFWSHTFELFSSARQFFFKKHLLYKSLQSLCNLQNEALLLWLPLPFKEKCFVNWRCKLKTLQFCYREL